MNLRQLGQLGHIKLLSERAAVHRGQLPWQIGCAAESIGKRWAPIQGVRNFESPAPNLAPATATSAVSKLHKAAFAAVSIKLDPSPKRSLGVMNYNGCNFNNF